jgi:hypothetical protein
MRKARLAILLLVCIMLVSGLACDGDIEEMLEDWAESTPTPTSCPILNRDQVSVDCLEGPLGGEYCLITVSGTVSNYTSWGISNVVVTFTPSKPETLVGICSQYIGFLPSGSTEDYKFICTSTGHPGAIIDCTVTCD